MGTHSKKKTTKMENGVRTTSYRNMPESYGFHKTSKKVKKKKAPTAYTMTSKDIVNKFKKKTA
jgi:hypothetical protein